MRTGLGLATILAALVSGQAQAACWTPSEVAAAKVRDFDTMLMVSALRCRMETPDIMAKYNAAVEHQRAPLTEMNGRIRAHFAAGVSANAGAAAYDTYVTRVANRYGAGVGGLSCAALSSIAEAASAEEPNADALQSLADRSEMVPDLGEGGCPAPVAIIASAAPHDAAPGLDVVPATTAAVKVTNASVMATPAVAVAGLQR